MADENDNNLVEEEMEEMEEDGNGEDEEAQDDGQVGAVRGRGRGRGRGGRGGFRGGARGYPPGAFRGGRGRGTVGSGYRPRGSIHNRVYVGNLSYSTSWQDLKDHMRQAGEVTFAEVFLDFQGMSKGCGVVEFAKAEDASTAIKTLSDTIIEQTDRPIFVREDRVEIFDEAAPPPMRGRGGMGGYRGAPPPYHRGGGGFRGARGGMYAPHVYHPYAGGYHHQQYNAPMPYGGGYGGRGRGGAPPPMRGRVGPHIEGSRQGRQVFVGNLPYTASWQDLKDLFAEVGPVLRPDILYGGDGKPKGMGTVCFDTAETAQKAIEKMNDSEFQGRQIHVSEDKYAN
jgi:hypothetical protein